MIILSVQHIKKAFGGNQVLRDVSFTLQSGQRMALVGVNGCGKTTFLRILAGEEAADDGVISLTKGLRCGYMAQRNAVTRGNTVLKELEDVFIPVVRMEERLREMEIEMASVADESSLKRLGDAYAQLNDQFEEAGGYGWKSAVQGVLAGLGFKKEQQGQLAESLSGGELTRLCLGRLLLQKPDLLLLDEPTNHLDLEALDWLEKYLTEYRGTVLVVSHDRYFLDRVCNCVTEILLGESEQYEGNYSAYMTQRAERFEARMRAYEFQQKEIARQEEVIRKLRSFNREKSIKRAESREKVLDRIERLDRPQDEKQVRFRFTARRRTGEDVLAVKNLSKSFGARTLFRNVQFLMHAGDRVALIGPNGVGKTTLLKVLIGEEAPDTGVVRWGANIDLGYYDQHQKQLHDDKTVLREVWDDFQKLDQTQVRSALGLFLLTGEDVFMPIHTLSGGERGRVALTKLMLHGDNLLLMDEPTNHLDVDSREVLEDALEDFTGTILSVSHDRYFINRFATHIYELTEDGIRVYEGNFDDYMNQRAREKQFGEMPEYAGQTRTQADKEKKRQRLEKEQLRRLTDAVIDAETAVATAERHVREQENLMASSAVYANPKRAAEAAREYQALKKELQDCYAAWEAAETALAEAKAGE